MNYLAHFFLSNNDPDLIIGNFIADHVKGKAYTNYSIEVQRGILLHREIDSYTDSHSVVMQSKERLFPHFHHYSAVIVDMFYDHILAKNWMTYSKIPLKEFTAKCYRILLSKEGLPPRASFMLSYMSEQDWLSSYASVEGINRALTGLSNRTSFDSKMEYASNNLLKDHESYSKEFNAFFPELILHCSNWLEQNPL